MPWWRDEILLILAVLTVSAFAWYLSGSGSEAADVDGYWLTQVVLDCAFCWLSWRVAGMSGAPRATRRFWRLIAVGGCLFLSGDTMQAIVAVRHPTLAASDASEVQGLLVAAGAAVCVIAMLSHPMKIAGKERLRFVLDAATMMAAAAIVIWYFVLGDALTGANLGSQLVSSALMLVSTFALIKLLLGGNAPFTRQAGILGGITTALNGLSTALGPMLMDSSHPNLSLAVRLLPCFLLVAVPRIQELQVRADPDVFTRRRRRAYSLLPYAAVAAAQVMLLQAALYGRLASVGVATGATSDTDAILRAADEAMYSAKHNGKNAFASTTV